MKKAQTQDQIFAELASLFFTTRQIIRSQVPEGKKADPNAWQRNEILRFIGEVQDPTMQEVAQYLRVKASSATSLISNLDKDGMIKRTSGTKDKRVVRVSLTAKGEREVLKYQKRATAMMQGAFCKLSRPEIANLALILRRVRDTQGVRHII